MAHLFQSREIDRLVNFAASGLDDAELLRRYRDSGDSEAFESIVRRHARTVLGVCRRILIEPHAAEDAFQATFLQLVRRARTLHSPVALAAWLCATARRTALRSSSACAAFTTGRTTGFGPKPTRFAHRTRTADRD